METFLIYAFHTAVFLSPNFMGWIIRNVRTILILKSTPPDNRLISEATWLIRILLEISRTLHLYSLFITNPSSILAGEVSTVTAWGFDHWVWLHSFAGHTTNQRPLRTPGPLSPAQPHVTSQSGRCWCLAAAPPPSGQAFARTSFGTRAKCFLSPTLTGLDFATFHLTDGYFFLGIYFF